MRFVSCIGKKTVSAVFIFLQTVLSFSIAMQAIKKPAPEYIFK
jgi:hypothetical protein